MMVLYFVPSTHHWYSVGDGRIVGILARSSSPLVCDSYAVLRLNRHYLVCPYL